MHGRKPIARALASSWSQTVFSASAALPRSHVCAREYGKTRARQAGEPVSRTRRGNRRWWWYPCDCYPAPHFWDCDDIVTTLDERWSRKRGVSRSEPSAESSVDTGWDFNCLFCGAKGEIEIPLQPKRVTCDQCGGEMRVWLDEQYRLRSQVLQKEEKTTPSTSPWEVFGLPDYAPLEYGKKTYR